MKTYKINTYQFEELNDKAKLNVIFWMSSNFEALDYEKEDGTIGYDYWEDMQEEDIQEHCEVNGYLFTEYGDPIHYLINK
jgi:hypothetical protein